MDKIEKLVIDILNKREGQNMLDVPGIMELNDDEMIQLGELLTYEKSKRKKEEA
jgi:hypothetical protein